MRNCLRQWLISCQWGNYKCWCAEPDVDFPHAPPVIALCWFWGGQWKSYYAHDSQQIFDLKRKNGTSSMSCLVLWVSVGRIYVIFFLMNFSLLIQQVHVIKQRRVHPTLNGCSLKVNFLYGRTDEWAEGRPDGRTVRWMYSWLEVPMDGQMNIWLDGQTDRRTKWLKEACSTQLKCIGLSTARRKTTAIGIRQVNITFWALLNRVTIRLSLAIQ